jgi:hypothetical protein
MFAKPGVSGPENVNVGDVTTLVRVPGQPAEVRVFTDDEKVEAAEHAAQTGGIIVALPQPMPGLPARLGSSATAGPGRL